MKFSHHILLIALCLFTHANQAFAIDLQPGELRALKPDTYLLMLSYQQSERGDRYIHGNKQVGNPEIQASQLQIRLGKSFEVADHPAIFYVQTPIGYVHPEGSLSRLEGDSGVGDTTFLFAFWPYANHETKSYFAVGAYLTAPTGSYDHERSFNMGQNRYSAALQAGYQAPLADAWSWMAALDAVWFSNNDAFGQNRNTLEQKVLYTSQVGLQYNISPRYSLGATYFYTTGGETSVNGMSRDDLTQLQRYQLTGVANFTFGRITLHYGGDLKTENGFIEDSRWILRYTKLF
ncbi:MAG: transporter [Methylotenera sp.]|nr:transporter [Methylotenera sp.]MDO9233182.1 transporter [Methylotenera sp.]MDO9387920.1 transporter [Methylotenera sp.]MDP2100986.1 transporter [Methylotenera sp.]MDP2281829.1 transporter [Methylotenera sp.]